MHEFENYVYKNEIHVCTEIICKAELKDRSKCQYHMGILPSHMMDRIGFVPCEPGCIDMRCGILRKKDGRGVRLKLKQEVGR